MFIEAKDGGGGGDNWTIGAISRGKAPVESSPPTNQHPVFFTGRMPNQRCQSTEGNISRYLWEYNTGHINRFMNRQEKQQQPRTCCF